MTTHKDAFMSMVVEPPLNRRQQAKARTRQKVLDAATVLFAGPGGYVGATIRDIAKGAGMSTGAVFANFEDKAALYRAVYEHDPVLPETGAMFLAEARRLVGHVDFGFDLTPGHLNRLRELIASVPADPVEPRAAA